MSNIMTRIRIHDNLSVFSKLLVGPHVLTFNAWYARISNFLFMVTYEINLNTDA
jgi:hypothetical protein